MTIRLVWSNPLSTQRFSVTLTPVRSSFGAVARAIRIDRGLSQKEVAEAGGLEQSRVSEIERGRYLPGLDMAMRLATGLGVTLTEIIAQWEGTRPATKAGAPGQRVGRRMPAAALDVPQEDLFRRVRGLWELMTADRRDAFLKQGKGLVAAQWREESRGEFPRPVEPTAKPRR